MSTPFLNDLGSGWFYYVAHSSDESYASDYRQHCIRKYDPLRGLCLSHLVVLLALPFSSSNCPFCHAGNWQPWVGICQSGSAGFRNARKNRARFDQPHGICVTVRGEVVVADTGNHCVRIISQEGRVVLLNLLSDFPI